MSVMSWSLILIVIGSANAPEDVVRLYDPGRTFENSNEPSAWMLAALALTLAGISLRTIC
jgi:hypothetical protein